MMRNVACLIAALCVATAAQAQDDARAHFMRGQAAYENGDYETSVREWTTAYGMDPRPLLQFNLAQAYERLGRLGEAMSAYERYVNASDNDPGRMSQARARIGALQLRLGNTSVRLHGGPEGAQILVDGQDRGRLPHPDPLRVEPGQHQVVVRAAGYADFALDTAVSPGQSLDVNVTMRAGTSGGVAVVGGGLGLSWIGIIVASAGAAAAITSIFTGLIAMNSAQAAPNSTGPEAADARSMALITDILLFGGIGLVGIGAILAFVLPADIHLGGSAQLRPAVGPGLAGLSLDGSF